MTNGNTRGEDDREIALEAREGNAGDRLYSPSVARNRNVIRDAFGRFMPTDGRILEIGSGTGEHGAHLVAAFPDLHWQPSDPDGGSRASIAAHGAATAGRMAPPLALRLGEGSPWYRDPGIGEVDGVVCINVIHISPPRVTEALFEGAAALLSPGQRLFLYGPFSRRGEMAGSNQRFDADLKRRDPSWGVRDLDDTLQPLGARYALHLKAAEDVPANNMVVVFEKG